MMSAIGWSHVGLRTVVPLPGTRPTTLLAVNIKQPITVAGHQSLGVDMSGHEEIKCIICFFLHVVTLHIEATLLIKNILKNYSKLTEGAKDYSNSCFCDLTLRLASHESCSVCRFVIVGWCILRMDKRLQYIHSTALG